MSTEETGPGHFEALHTKWSRIHELLSLGLLSPDLDAHLAVTLLSLESRMRDVSPARAAAVLTPRTGRRRPSRTVPDRLAA